MIWIYFILSCCGTIAALPAVTDEGGAVTSDCPIQPAERGTLPFIIPFIHTRDYILPGNNLPMSGGSALDCSSLVICLCTTVVVSLASITY